MSSNPPTTGPAKVHREEFCRACGRFATGVAVATVLDAADEPHGITVNSFTSVSVAPPLVLICVGHAASILAHFHRAHRFGINFLREDQQSISTHFARKGRDGFKGVAWEAGETGVPLIPGTVATLECERVRMTAAGDHDILIGEVVHTHVHPGRPLLYYGSAYRTLVTE